MNMHTIRGTMNLKTGRFTNSVDVVNQQPSKDGSIDHDVTRFKKVFAESSSEDEDLYIKDANFIARETIAALRNHKENPSEKLDTPDPMIREHYGFISAFSKMREEQKAKEATEKKAAAKPPSAADLMEKAGDTYRQRGAVYGASYRIQGDVMKALFPNGVSLDTVEDHQRFGVLTIMISKLCRYANQFANGGHEDSVHDLGVYSFILQELDKTSRIEETE